MKTTIAYFISPHGFGHAARACAVMESIRKHDSSVHFEIYTRVPEWFFSLSLGTGYVYHDCLTDIGIVQPSPIHEDLSGTLKALDHFIPFVPAGILALADEVRHNDCRMVLCDISPLGIAVAREADIPSMLIENFTWDWIYASYVEQKPEFRRHIDYLKTLFDDADYHVQTRPVCQPGPADLVTEPVSRNTKRTASKIKSLLEIEADQPFALITMGGIVQRDFAFLDKLGQAPGIQFVAAGVSEKMSRRGANLLLLPNDSDFYHPDLVHAADLVIAKLGYSTIAEAYQAGIPYLYLERPGFRESQLLADFIENEMHGGGITEASFHAGEWLHEADRLCRLERIQRDLPRGAEQIARFLAGLLSI